MTRRIVDSVIVPATPDQAFDVVSDIEHAEWMPGVKELRHVSGPATGEGAVYEAQVFGGRQKLLCSESKRPTTMVLTLEDGLDLTVRANLSAVSGGTQIQIDVLFGLSGFGSSLREAAAEVAARAQLGRALEALGAQLSRKS